jgi:hypothetical protein
LDAVKTRAFRRLAVLLIVSGASACDNVEWGGIEVRRQFPAPAAVGDTSNPVQSGRDTLRALPTAPMLYMVERDSVGLKMIPVGEIFSDSLGAFPGDDQTPGYRARFVRELLPRGSEFVLFASGVRVGGFTVQSVETDNSFCVPRPAARGVTELIAEAMEQTRFLALPREHARAYGWGAYEVLEMDREQRDASLSLPATILGQLRAERTANIIDMRWDARAFRPAGNGPAWFAATYLLRDRMRVERPPPTAFSLFLLAVPGPAGYETAYSWYRHVSLNGKGAARFFEQIDWSGDGQTDVLLEVLGEQKRWMAAVQQRGGTWTRVFEEPCGAGSRPITAGN